VCELGERLRRAREAKGLSLKEAAERLALKASVLEALEACRFEALPEPPLARGYLRRYALLLGLDPEPLLALYPSTSEPPPSPPAKPRKRSLPLGLLLALFFLLALGYGAYLLLRPRPVQVVEVAPPSPSKPPERYPLRVVSEPPGGPGLPGRLLSGPDPPGKPSCGGGERVLRLELSGYEPLEAEVFLKGPLASPTA
jgi:cytoskeleton protein RodZ